MDKQKFSDLNWWAVTAILAFFPIIFSIFIGLFVHSFIDSVSMMIGDGELILSSFLVSTPSLINSYRNKEKNGDAFFIILLLLAIFQIGAYAMIRVSTEIGFFRVFAFSFFFVASSLFISWRNEKFVGDEK